MYTMPNLLDSSTLGDNIRRLMAREGLTYEDVIAGSGLDERTIRSLLRGKQRPHARTLGKLAAGLGVSVDELLQPPGTYSAKEFDFFTNPLVKQLAESEGDVFQDWSESDFANLASRFGTGGQLTETRVLEVVEKINENRQVLRQVDVLLGTHEAELLKEIVEVLYQRVTEFELQ